VLRWKLATVHFVREEDVGPRFLQRDAAGELQLARRTLRIFEHAAIRSFQNYLTGICFNTGAVEQDR
jgi:hypothetical protein